MVFGSEGGGLWRKQRSGCLRKRVRVVVGGRVALDAEMMVSWLVVFRISHEKCNAVCFFSSSLFLYNCAEKCSYIT
jgi:hypothetical protein